MNMRTKNFVKNHLMMSKAIRAYSRGLTLLELMVALSILAILAGIAIPSFNETIRAMRVRSAAESVVASLSLAKSEAIKRGGNVSIVMTAPNWSSGFRIQDTLNNTTLKNIPAFDGTTLTNMGGVTVISIDRWGKFGGGAAAANFSIVPNSGTSNSNSQKAVCVSVGGRIALRSGVTTCS